MRKILVVVALVGAACREPEPRSPVSTGTVEYVMPAPQPPSAPQPPPAPANESTAPADCKPTTELSLIQRYWGVVPLNISDDDIFNSILQIIVSAAIQIETQDRGAHIITTKPFDGQWITTTCGIQHRRKYALRIAIVGRRAIIDMDCWESVGEATYWSPTRTCSVQLAAKVDAAIPDQVFNGALDMITLQRMTNPPPTPPASDAEIRSARWWCCEFGEGGGGTCRRDRNDCEELRRTSGIALTECRPARRAVCFAMQALPEVGRSASILSCHPTDAACEDQLRFARTQTKRVRIVRGCRPTD